MALSIGVNVGSKIMVGETLLMVEEISSGRNISIMFGKDRHLITDEKRTKVADDVFISCGNKNPHGAERYTRLAFEAPRAVQITRVTN